MRDIVTGGAGFIGSHLVDSLIITGRKVTIIDNLSLGQEHFLKKALAQESTKFIEGDINDSGVLKEAFNSEPIDNVYHFAANSDIKASHADPTVDLKSTFLTTFNVLNEMRVNQVRSIVFASTSAIYGEAPLHISENYGPLFPVSHYGAAKLSSEAFISSFCANYGIKCTIIRFPNVIGPRSTHGVIFDFINKLINNRAVLDVLGDGKQEKPYLHVSDLIRAIHLVKERSVDRVNYYNIGSDTSSTVKFIAESVISEMNSTAIIKYSGGSIGWIGDVPKFQYDLTKIKSIGWKSLKTSDEAVVCAIRELLMEIPWKR